jgi:hypothetical protein
VSGSLIWPRLGLASTVVMDCMGAALISNSAPSLFRAMWVQCLDGSARSVMLDTMQLPKPHAARG